MVHAGRSAAPYSPSTSLHAMMRDPTTAGFSSNYVSPPAKPIPDTWGWRRGRVQLVDENGLVVFLQESCSEAMKASCSVEKV